VIPVVAPFRWFYAGGSGRRHADREGNPTRMIGCGVTVQSLETQRVALQGKIHNGTIWVNQGL
jgi:hypothetical protein